MNDARELSREEVAEAWETSLNGFHDDEWGHSEEGGWFALVGRNVICQIGNGFTYGWGLDSEDQAAVYFGQIVAANELLIAITEAEEAL